MGLTLIACSMFVSCGNSGVAGFAKKSVDSVASLIPGRVPVAKVRPADLKQMPSGADRALAWDKHLDAKRYASVSRWWKPKNYRAPALPDTRTIPTGGGILPPLKPGQGSSLNGRGDLPAN